MHVERIEISGFKSFADKTTVVFDSGLTAVVGPNGSGKSNLSEAIKWVLGEQSVKSLRGKKMDDIIFSGSQTRKSTNIAEVTLVLNNEDRFLPLDFSEIQLTRRLNRNGDSECFINKKPCRLKDIVNLLMDSGLGKESFSIISQGKIETIFQNKPEDRRGMFEEVAGVLKYKTRKNEASRKLEKTQEHLNRIEDILFEINNQLEPLKQQKEKAEIYVAKKNELSQVDIALMVAEIESNHAQLQIVDKQLIDLNKQLNDKENENKQYSVQMTRLRQQFSKVEQNLIHLQDEFVFSVQKVETLNGDQKVIFERLAYSKQNKGQQDNVKFEKEEQLKQLNEELQKLVHAKEDKQKQLINVQNDVKRVQKEQYVLSENSEKLLEQERQRYIDTLQLQTKYQNELQQIEKNNGQLNARLLRLKGQHEQLLNEKTILIQNNDQINTQLQQLSNELKQLTKQHSKWQKQLLKLQQQKHTDDELIVKKQQEQQQLQAKVNSLKDLSDDYAGYYQGVREILKQKKKLQGIHGSVAELINVSKQYETAIEIALGASLQHIIVTDEKSATQAISYLKSHKLGRSTFLPISVIKGKSFPKDIQNVLVDKQGYIGIASELIETNEQYANVISHILGHTIICESIELAIKLAKVVQYRYRIVTLDGEVVHASGSMTGGALNNKKSSLLSRQTDLEQLSQKVSAVTSELQQMNLCAKQTALELSHSQEQLNCIQQEGTSKRLLERELSISLEQHNKQIETLQRQIDVIVLDIKQIEQEVLQNDGQYNTITIELKKVIDNVVHSRTLMAQMNASQDEKANKMEQLQKEWQQLNTNLAILKEQVQVANTQEADILHNIKEITIALESIKIAQHEVIQNKDSLELQLQTLESSIEKELANKERLEKLLNSQREEKKDLDVAIVICEEHLQSTQETVQQLLKQQGRLQSQIERYNVTIDTHLSRLSTDYELTYEGAKQRATLHMTIGDASTFVNRLKREIEQLGPVNLEAITEYDVILDRFTFMSEQQSDLLKAKEQLLLTMNDMDKEVEKRFSETFYAIKSQFEKTFPKLFGGGRATLELTEPTNLLETGIDIIAQPPGKRLQNLSLLSGGERAFTAIALLFAILEVKPVPFCLLDEVEAALDEANVSRYGRYLKSFTDQTQFIVITHRKGTMEEADVLYGVTMQESGVSKLASVRMEDYS